MFIGEESAREFISRSRPLQSGFKTWSTQLGQAFDSARYEDQSVSRAYALYDQADAYVKRFETETGEKFGVENPYFDLGRTGTPVDVVSDVWAKWAGADLDAHAPWTPQGRYERLHGDFWSRVDEIAAQYPDFKVDEAGFMQNIADKAENLRNARDTGQVRWGGGLADFIGSTGGLMTDPVNLASMVFGGGAASGARSLLARLMSTASREAGIGMAAEAVIQPHVMDFKEEIGVDYGVDDAIGNIAQAGIGGAVFGVGMDFGGMALRGGLRHVRQRWQAATDDFPELADMPGARDAQSVIDDVIAAYDQSPFEESLTGNIAHERAFTTALAQIMRGEPVELREVFDGLKRVPETKPIKKTIDEGGKAAAGDAPLDGDGAPLDLGPNLEILDDDAINSLFDAGKEPPKPRDVLAIIKDMGGIKPEGETRAMDLQTVRPGLVRKAGRSFGEIREHLEEIGMLPEGSADNDVFDLIDDAVRGNPGGVYHPADFDRAMEWEAWRNARENADISREYATSLAGAARQSGRELSADELRDVMMRTDPRSGDDPAEIVARWLEDDARGPLPDPANDLGVDLSGRPAGLDIDWARALELAETPDEAAASARQSAIRRAASELTADDIARIEAEARQRFAEIAQNRPAGDYSRAELAERIKKIFEKPDDDFDIVDPENFDADGNPVTISAREFLERSKDEYDDAAIVAQCILNKVA